MNKKLIALDAGHGMVTAGKRCLQSLDPNQTREWWLNDRIMDQVQSLLATYDCQVLRVDDTTGAKDISLSARVKAANSAKANIYISMHHNAGLNGRSGGGTVVYYSSNKLERAVQAQKLYNAIIHRTGLSGNRSEKVVKKGFYVIAHTTMPAFLVENGFMDSPTDVPVILSDQHAARTAVAVVEFLVDALQLKKEQTESGSQSPAGTTVEGNTADSAYYPAYTGKKTTLSAAMTSLRLNSTYAYRKKIASANGIQGYMGTAAQNTLIYNLLVAGRLKRA